MDELGLNAEWMMFRDDVEKSHIRNNAPTLAEGS